MYAGFWKRFAAAVMDLLILIVPMVVVGIIVALITGPKSIATAAADLSTLVALWLYFAAMESSRRQATLGKLAFGIRVVDLRGNRISFLRASARLFAKLFSMISLALGYVMAAFTRRKQALHDMIASSLVINAHVSQADLRQAGFAEPLSTGRILTLMAVAVCMPVAGAGVAVAIPLYRDYQIRTSLNEAIDAGLSSAARLAPYVQKHGAAPHALQAGDTPPSPHVREWLITPEGRLVLTLAIRKLEGKHIALVPSAPARGEIAWTCTSEDIPQRYLPSQCRGASVLSR